MRMLGLLILAPVVVVEVERVDKIAEQRQTFFAGLFLWLLGGCRLFRYSTLLLVERHTGLVEYMLFNIDRHICPHRQRDRIAWPRVDLDRMAALLDNDACVECAVVDIADEDVDDRGS